MVERASPWGRGIKDGGGFYGLHQRSELLGQRLPLASEASALKKLCLELGDLSVTERWFDAEENEELAAVTASTWKSLERHGWVRRGRGARRNTYRLTDAGWVAALEVAGMLSGREFRSRCQALVGYFESQLAIQAIPRGALISPHRLEGDGFPWGWVLNVVRNGLLARVFPDRYLDARWDPSLQNIRVPPGFGGARSPSDSPEPGPNEGTARLVHN